MSYHIIIAEERRVSTEEQPRELAIPMSSAVATGNTVETPMGVQQEFVAGPQQLHSLTSATLPDDFSDHQFVMVAEWDGVSPYVVMYKGDYSTRNMAYAGWPDLTKEQYEESTISNFIS